jgi:hypothetical protein
MTTKKLQDFALAAGAKVEGEQIIFADEWQLERCMSLAVKSTFEALGDMNREQRDRAHALLDRWRDAYGSRYERLGKEDHYAEGVTLLIMGVNTRQRRSDLPKAQRDEIEAQVEGLAGAVKAGS